jgi:sigma-B regulation protein RsbU (phosphoserine phosphatase)
MSKKKIKCVAQDFMSIPREESKVLIVDDVPANLDLLRQVLKSEPYNLSVAPSGEVALKVAAQAIPDLILLDVMMPGMDGFDTCRRLKTDPATANIPIIFITAKDEIESVVEGFQAGGVDYITKPFQSEEVQARVKTHLTIKHLQDELERAYNLLAVDNARKTEELQTARMIQQGFLPDFVPELTFLEIAAFQRTATEVGGDYYDFFPCEDGSLVLVVGDATGHGAGASLMVSATKTALLTIEASNLSERISRINSLLKRINNYRLLHMALTLIELEHNEKAGIVRAKAVGGGMPPLYLLRASGHVEEIAIEGLPLGAIETAAYQVTEFQLQKSDLLLFMSDGLPERINDADEFFGYARLLAEIKKAGRMSPNASGVVKHLIRAIDDWSNHTPQNDDMTIVALKVK